MKPSTRRRIEAIAAPILDSSGYSVNPVGTPVRVPGILMLLYQLLDGYNLVKSNVKERGIIAVARGVKDVRDYCLSIKKAWGKNMIRAAQRWTDCIHKIRRDSCKFPDDYLEIRYEQLIETPEPCLKQICAFLEIEFQPEMLHLSQPPENIGDTKNEAKIVAQNKEKYLRSMKPSTRRRIEAIAAPILDSSGYSVNPVGTPVRVPGILMLLYQLLDGYNLVKSNVKERGIIAAIRFQVRYFLISGNRTIDKT